MGVKSAPTRYQADKRASLLSRVGRHGGKDHEKPSSTTDDNTSREFRQKGSVKMPRI